MANLTGKDRALYVRRMFARIAERYDRANHWMTWGQDIRWRQEVIDRADLPPKGRLLDVGCGTGDLAIEAMQRDANLHAIGADFTPEMIQAGRTREDASSVLWLTADALNLPFRLGSFDAVVSGYLLRNVTDIKRALAEQFRVLRSGGCMVALDTAPPSKDIWHLPVRLYMQIFIPIIGRLISGDSTAYHYLPDSTSRFIKAEELAASMKTEGFRDIHKRCFMGGSMVIAWGRK